ncbi:MAG: ABC transporter ATP-binding protein [Chloroflexi bacterium]|nr:ABC transporter ATP-binding protein [Chloroflexota bacterium]MBP8057203.1 ABC transporter ATP-binding protein [Chloroflexota bacterium]
MTGEKKVSCQGLYKSFADKKVVRNVYLNVTAGAILALVGPSGCGKTTTLRAIAGFETLDSGRIEIAGLVVADEGRHLPPEKRRVGMVFQDYAIFPHLNVAQNVAFGLGRDAAATQRTLDMLAFVGLEGLGSTMPHELSGGQQQRVALARALAPEPAVLLLDEPFSNLDYTLRKQVRTEIRSLLKQTEATAIFVTHDQEEALFIGDQVAVMHQGHIEQVDTPERVFHQPQSRFVASFVGETSFLPGIVTERGVVTVLGVLPQIMRLGVGTSVEVSLRPDDVTIAAAAAGNGHILSRQFMGIAHLYRVALQDGTIIQSWQPHTLNLSPGTSVQASFLYDHPLTCFAGETVVNSL